MTVRIVEQRWGQIVTDAGTFKDVRIRPGAVMEWDWRVTGTRHRPGIQVADLDGLLADADVVLLSRGVLGVLQVPDETVAFAEAEGVAVETLRTEAAVARYAELVSEGRAVAALLHSTC